MTTHKHQQYIQTAAGQFCRDCGEARIYEAKRPKSKKAVPTSVGIARIWERQ